MTEAVYDSVTRDWPSASLSRFPAQAFRFSSSTGSTNDDLRDWIKGDPELPFRVVATDHQTAGRGRRGDPWQAPAKRNLLFSVGLRLGDDPSLWTRLPLVVVHLLGRVVESLATDQERVQVKWPNDLYKDGKKLAGILVETVEQDGMWAIIGIGLNVNMRASETPPEIKSIATSLRDWFGCESHRWYILGLILKELISTSLLRPESFQAVTAWIVERDFLVGKRLRVELPKHSLVGVAKGLGATGELLLEDEDGETHSIISATRLVLC